MLTMLYRPKYIGSPNLVALCSRCIANVQGVLRNVPYVLRNVMSVLCNVLGVLRNVLGVLRNLQMDFSVQRQRCTGPPWISLHANFMSTSYIYYLNILMTKYNSKSPSHSQKKVIYELIFKNATIFSFNNHPPPAFHSCEWFIPNHSEGTFFYPYPIDQKMVRPWKNML